MRTRFVTFWAAFVRGATRALLVALAAVPWLLGLLVGLLVSLTLWIIVAAMDGYKIGRGS